MDSIVSVLEESFVEWLPSRVAARVPMPVPLSTIDIDRPSCSQLLGYFEQVINTLVGYKRLSAEDTTNQDLEDEYESAEKIQMEITEKLGKLLAANFGQSDATCAVEEDIPKKPRKLTDKVRHELKQDFDNIKLEEAEMTTANSRLLDLVRMRKNNKDIFNDETKTSLCSKKPNTYSCDSVLRNIT